MIQILMLLVLSAIMPVSTVFLVEYIDKLQVKRTVNRVLKAREEERIRNGITK